MVRGDNDCDNDDDDDNDDHRSRSLFFAASAVGILDETYRGACKIRNA